MSNLFGRCLPVHHHQRQAIIIQEVRRIDSIKNQKMNAFYTHTSDNEFVLSRFQEMLRTKYIGRSFIYRTEVESTMDVAKNEAEAGCPTGTLILSELQTKGRGRKGREWSSSGRGKNLYFTLVFHIKPEHAMEMIKLNLAIPLATTLTLKEEGLKKVGIKWPNDVWVYADNEATMPKKISGMLIDSVQSGDSLYGLAGVGINLNQTFGGESVDSGNHAVSNVATSVQDTIGKSVDREKFLAYFCNTLEALLGFSQKDVITLYKENDLLIGKEINVIPSDPNTLPYVAKAVGISKFGNLRIELKDGTGVKELIAEEVSIRPLPNIL